MKLTELNDQEAHFNSAKAKIQKGEYLTEDPRNFDWKYFLQIYPGMKVLLLGDDLDLMNPLFSSESLSEVENNYDLVIDCRKKGELENLTLDERLNKLQSLLKPDGSVFLLIENRFGFHRAFSFFRPNKAATTLKECKNKLLKKKFKLREIYAPIPKYNELPLMILPVCSLAALGYFCKKLFPLFNTVSPEVKQRYKFEFTLAKAGIFFASKLRLYKWLPLFFSGFWVYAAKERV